MKNTAEKILVAMGLIALFGVIVFTCLGILQARANAMEPPTPTQMSQRGPDISHCFAEGEERDLWDCIRHVD